MKKVHLYTLSVGLGVLAFSIPLIAYGVNGAFMRYSGDDYCYAAVLSEYGFWEAQWRSYFEVTTYHGNRYSLTLFSHLADLFGPKANGWLPGLALILWVGSLYFVFRKAAQLLNRPIKAIEAMLLAEAVVFLVLHRTPDIAQSLYWRSGMLPYFMPLVFNTILLGAFLSICGQSERPLLLYGGILFSLAVLGGGFSETGVAFQGGFWTLIVLGSYIFAHRSSWRFRAPLFLSATIWLGTLVALFLLALSPVVKARLMDLPSPPNLLALLEMCFRYAAIFALKTMKQVYENVVILAFFFFFGFYSATHHPLRVTTLRLLPWKLFLVVGGGILLLLCCMAPSAYAESSYPELRALILARFVVVVIIGITAWVVGEIVGSLSVRLSQPSRFSAMALLFLSILYVYPLFHITEIRTNTPLYQKWAQFWDARDQRIRELKQQGFSEIHVMEIDHVIPNVMELSRDAAHWYTNCAEVYYGVRAIYADQPGWDEKVLP